MEEQTYEERGAQQPPRTDEFLLSGIRVKLENSEEDTFEEGFEEDEDFDDDEDEEELSDGLLPGGEKESSKRYLARPSKRATSARRD